MQRLERRSDRWISAGLSVLLHGTLIGALIYGWWTFRHQPSPPPTLAIDATVVSSKSLKGGPAGVEHKQPPPPAQTVSRPIQPPPPQTVTPPPQTTPPPSLSDDQTVPSPPKPTPDEQAEKAKEQAERKAEAEAQRKAAERKAEQEADQRAAEQAAAERKAKEAQAKKHAEQQRVAEAKRKAEAERKAEEQRAADAKALAASQAELAQGVDAEEKLLAERSGPAMASWAQLITARIQRAWIRPPTARPGIDCFIDITQLPDGEVSNVKVGACNGDEAVRQSIQDAAFRASPLPPPSDPALFEREIQVEFKPTE